MKTENTKLAILIVLYNTHIESCVTVQKVLQFFKHTKSSVSKCSVTIWNNGPNVLNTIIPDEYNCNVKIIQTINNLSLSYIYNKFLNSYTAENYLILDHDSIIPDDYIIECQENKNLFRVPQIQIDGILYSPKEYRKNIINNEKLTLAISSGLCISKNGKNILKEKFSNIFDERFHLYGIDSTFFIRINKLKLSTEIYKSSCFIRHSLSRLEKENPDVKAFRTKERSYDQGLTLRYYPSFFTFKISLRKIIATILLNRKEINIKFFFKALISGKHYKADKI